MTRYHLEVLDAKDYINVRLNGDSLMEFIGREAVRRAQAKGVVLPHDATVNFMFNGKLITVEIFKQEEEVLCTPAKHYGTSTLYWPE